ncbi:hypothetical protein [Leptospira noguchii]|uniref:hypothetical protein n=1 Tax=Leptospira noguchii TaxID=28182 RepID=UPI002852E581|nr:hypothetical protein [Leptospira noguchii]
MGAKRTQHNAFLWVGVQGVVAPEFIVRPNFLTSNSRFLTSFFMITGYLKNILEYPELAF